MLQEIRKGRPNKEVMEAIHKAGGRAIVVGGWVRDHLLGIESKDIDIEVLGLAAEELERVLGSCGKVNAVGRAFGVFKAGDDNTDYSLPRTDSKINKKHTGFEVRMDPDLGFKEAAKRRDLTINAMGMDALTGEILDPHGGQRDLAQGTLRATDPERFGEDPLRGVRVAQLGARLEMRPDTELVEICRGLDLKEIAAERMGEEMKKLLLRSRKPSLGLQILEQTALLRYMPELESLKGVEQDQQWHPEGDVWVHTQMVVDEAAKLRTGEETDLILMLAALCHDLGKQGTTEFIDGRIRARGHEEAGVEPTGRLLERWKMPTSTIEQVKALVEHHLAPATFPREGTGLKGYKRLVRKLTKAGTTPQMLEKVARADQLGRTTPDALARRFDSGKSFLEVAEQKEVTRDANKDTVQGRHLIAKGMRPGPIFKEILDRCRDVQDETGWTDAERILERAQGVV